MAWPSHTIQSWHEFMEIVDAVATVATPLNVSYVFRGQTDFKWELIPSIARILRNQDVVTVMQAEKVAIEEFKMHAHLYISSAILDRTTDFGGWWTLMQHYRAPTRVLDWTSSPYVAAYFAVENNWETDGAVWMFGVQNLQTQMTAKYGSIDITEDQLDRLFFEPTSPPQIFIIRRNDNTERMIAQQGGFTLCRQPLYNHANAIEEAFIAGHSSNWLKIIIPATLKQEFLRRLRIMNIAANALFPGIDGVGRSVAELLRIL